MNKFQFDTKIESKSKLHSINASRRLLSNGIFFSPIGGTTYRGFTIQFKLVPGVNFSFLLENYFKNPCWGDRKQGVSGRGLFSLKTITTSSQ